MRFIEESRSSRRIISTFNSTFSALIPEQDNLVTFGAYMSISLYNYIYIRQITKIIYIRVKSLLSESISSEQFGFIKGSKIHEVTGVAQGGLQSIKTWNLGAMILNFDILKAYDRVK